MTTYTKKPVQVQAWQLTKENYDAPRPAFLRQARGVVSLWSNCGGKKLGGEIFTSSRDTKINENDYIVLGEFGNWHVLSPDTFHKTYDKAVNDGEV